MATPPSQSSHQGTPLHNVAMQGLSPYLQQLSSGVTGMLASAVAELPLFICILDFDGHIHYVNERFGDFDGVRSDFQRTQDFEVLFPGFPWLRVDN